MSIALGELAVRFGCELRGDPDVHIDAVAPLSSAGPGTLSFLSNPKLAWQLAQTRASAVVLDARSAASCPAPALISPNPHALFARIAGLLYPEPPLRPGVHPSAVVDEAAEIDASAEVGAHGVIGAGAVIHPGSVIGADGFGYAREGASWLKVPRIGAVRIGDDVEIGANATNDPGAI